MLGVSFDSLKSEAEKLGTEHGTAAGSWAEFDDRDAARRFLDLLQAGDPVAYDMIPGSPLSGEWADGMTMGRLLEEIGVEDPHAELSFNPEPWDEIADAYCDAYSLAAEREVERIALFHADRVTAEVGTTGDFVTLDMSDDPGADLAAAIDAEHHCEDNSCDIAAALEAGCPFSAAYLLLGATETPLLEAVLEHHGLNLDLSTVPDWDEWTAYHREHGVQCDACGSFTYGDDYWTPEQCGNCLAVLPVEPDDDDEPDDDGPLYGMFTAIGNAAVDNVVQSVIDDVAAGRILPEQAQTVAYDRLAALPYDEALDTVVRDAVAVAIELDTN